MRQRQDVGYRRSSLKGREQKGHPGCIVGYTGQWGIERGLHRYVVVGTRCKTLGDRKGFK